MVIITLLGSSFSDHQIIIVLFVVIIAPSSSPFCCDLTFLQWSSLIQVFIHGQPLVPSSAPVGVSCEPPLKNTVLTSYQLSHLLLQRNIFHACRTVSYLMFSEATQQAFCLERLTSKMIFFSRIVSSTDNRQWVLYSII